MTDDVQTSGDAENPTDPNLWVEAYGDYLLRYAVMRVGDQITGEDMVQETFLAAFKSRNRFDGSRPIKYWLRGILKHKIVDYFRKSSRETLMEDPEDKEMSESFNYKAFGIATRNPPSWDFDPVRAFEKEEFMEVFRLCLGKLADPMRTVFVLKELEGQKTEEICNELDLTPNHVWVLMHRARLKLKECIQANWNQELNS